jgi:lysophospholipase L1-like esterase
MRRMSRPRFHESDPTPLALRRLGVIAAAVTLLSLLTYAVPDARRLRPWMTDEGIPVARMFQHSIETLSEDFTEAEMDLSNVEAELSLDTQADHGGHFLAEPEAGLHLVIAPEDYGGITQFIEGPELLSGFFAKMLRAARAEPGEIARVAHYGDSAVAADAITSTVRRRLQARFGDAGHGFMLLAHGDMYYVHRDVENRSSEDWDVYSVVRDQLEPGFYGYGGVQTRGRPGATAMVGTSTDPGVGRNVSRFELFYQRHRGSGSLELKIDDQAYSTIDTNSPEISDGFEVIELPDGPHSLSVKVVGAPVRVYGAVLERAEPGVVYDSLGLVGARATRLLNGEPDHVRNQIARRNPDLLVLGFGGNESGNKWLNLEQYARDLVRVIGLMRSAKRDMSCLLLGPLDQAERNERGAIVTLEVLPKIVQVQRRVAKEQGCAFYDVFSAMGGAGSMGEWLKSRPRLSTSDLRHATPAGYEVIGNLYYRAMLKAFAGYLADGGSS